MSQFLSIFYNFIFLFAILSIVPLTFHFTRKYHKRWRVYWMFLSSLYVLLWGLLSLNIYVEQTTDGMAMMFVGMIFQIPIAFLTLILLIGGVVKFLDNSGKPSATHSVEKHLPRFNRLTWIITLILTFLPLTVIFYFTFVVFDSLFFAVFINPFIKLFSNH